jgi:hypothetical protein
VASVFSQYLKKFLSTDLNEGITFQKSTVNEITILKDNEPIIKINKADDNLDKTNTDAQYHPPKILLLENNKEITLFERDGEYFLNILWYLDKTKQVEELVNSRKESPVFLTVNYGAKQEQLLERLQKASENAREKLIAKGATIIPANTPEIGLLSDRLLNY